MQCPCHSGKEYQECCKTFHQGELPPDALKLMRSRYSAYALNNADYIIETTHPNHPYQQRPKKEWKKSILTFCQNTTFRGLSILTHNLQEPLSTVTFHAELTQNGQNISFTEKSTFEKVQGKWMYLVGEIS